MTPEVLSTVATLKGEPVALVQLAAGASITTAAERAGVSPRTLRRRLATVEYRTALNRLRSEYLDETLGQLVLASIQATRTLTDLLDPSVPPATRLSAARIVLEQVVHYSENQDFRTRIEDLEQLALTGTNRTT